MISQTAEYALRAAVCLGSDSSEARPARHISELTRVPESYLSKILGALGRAGLVTARRGPRGGFALARDPGAVTLLEIIRAVEPWKAIDRCPLGRPDHADRLCALHRRLAEAQQNLEVEFGRATLREFIHTNDDGACIFPARPPA